MPQSKPSRRISYAIFWGLTIFAIVGFIWSLFAPKNFQWLQMNFQQIVLPLGWVAPFIFILIQVAQVIFPPISHYTVGVLGGFLYGPLYGGILNWIGRLIGHSTAFVLSKKFGRPLVERYVDSSMLNKFDNYLAGKNVNGFNNQSMILFLIYFLPLFPDDEISYIAGLTSMKFWTFFICNLLGHLGGAFSLAYIGCGKVSSEDPLFWILLITTIIGAMGMLIMTKRPVKETIE